jgi:Sideroflexins
MPALYGCDGSAVRGDLVWANGRTLLTSRRALERASELVRDYRYGRIPEMTEDVWKAKKSKPRLCVSLIDSC